MVHTKPEIVYYGGHKALQSPSITIQRSFHTTHDGNLLCIDLLLVLSSLECF